MEMTISLSAAGMGEFRKYSRSGDLLWTTTLPDRVGAIEVEKSSVFVTSGLHIVCLDAKTGQIVSGSTH